MPKEGCAVTDSDLENLIREYYDRLHRVALYLCSDSGAARDLVQETFTTAIAAYDRFEGRSSRYTWLYGIFKNKFKEWLRDKKKNKNISLQHQANQFELSHVGELVVSDIPESSGIFQQEERAIAVRKAIDELPPHHKNVVILRYMAEMSYEEISEVEDCSVGTVKSRMHYALKKVGHKLRSDPRVDHPEETVPAEEQETP